ncbi:hypothetical protein [Desulfovibrio sp. DV]|uniref:hypothetical protein n=1 Tax=Desulfovibrio sp. DV TaxID=1844708 RepID=UPI00094BB308|nr:hypothetical protein [Desulfovibrio sp. DV]
MKLISCAIAIVASLVFFTASQTFATTLSSYTLLNTGSNNNGQVWISVQDPVSKTNYNFLFPSTYSQTFLATALTALSTSKPIGLDVVDTSPWAGVNAIWIEN